MNRQSRRANAAGSATRIRCARHGSAPWRATLQCAPNVGGCGAVYQARNPNAPHFAQVDCVCGKRLLPDLEAATPPEFTGRAICSCCFHDKKAGPN